MPVVELGDVDMFFTDDGDGPPVLLVHGWTCDSHDWVFQIDAFAERHRVIAVDLRGHGRSSAPVSDYTAQRYAADIALLLERLDVDPVVVVGHSLGGSVAAVLAVEYPALVRAMVAVEPAYGQPQAGIEWMREMSQQFGDDAGNELATQLQAATEPTAPAWLKTWHRRRGLGMRPGLLAQSFQDMYFSDTDISGQPNTDPYLARRTCPTLAFHRLPDMAEWERGTLTHPASRVVSWEGGGHWLHQDRPVEFNALVLSWIGDLAGVETPTLQAQA